MAGKLSLDVNSSRDHTRGPENAPVVLVQYADYECPHCRLAQPGLEDLLKHMGDRVRYVFRHLPNTNRHPRAWRLAMAAEAAAAQGKFWEMHERLLRGKRAPNDDELHELANTLGLDMRRFEQDLNAQRHAEHIREDIKSAEASGAPGTPSFYINGKRYDGPWDQTSMLEAFEEPLGYRVRRLSQEFASIAASGGLVLLASTLVALIWANSPWAESYQSLWSTTLSISVAGNGLSLSLYEWVNDALMALFFLVMGLEIKREVIAGELSSLRKAVLPVAGALGGMLIPALIYLAFNAGSEASNGWGIPMATDIAFTLGLLAILGSRVPATLKVFVAALAIADDIGAILVIALFYTENISFVALGIAVAWLLVAIAFNRARVYRPWPYGIIAVGLWVTVLYSGVHATLAGVLLAMAIPTRSPPSTRGLFAQSLAAFGKLRTPDDGKHRDKSDYQSAIWTLEVAVGRLLSPAQRLERNLNPWSSYLVLPLFALSNAGIALSSDAFNLASPVSLGVVLGLVLGKPLGICTGVIVATKANWADLPAGVSWRHMLGAASLCGIGFTMSILIAGAAFTEQALFDQIKLMIMIASIIAGIIGYLILRSAPKQGTGQSRSNGQE